MTNIKDKAARPTKTLATALTKLAAIAGEWQRYSNDLDALMTRAGFSTPDRMAFRMRASLALSRASTIWETDPGRTPQDVLNLIQTIAEGNGAPRQVSGKIRVQKTNSHLFNAVSGEGRRND